MKLALNLILVILIGSSSCFFEYRDCDVQCQRKALPCIIEEINPNYFTCECMDSGLACEVQAGPKVPCLRPGKPAIGGEDIYRDWLRHHSTTTTPPSTTTANTTDSPSGSTTIAPVPTPSPSKLRIVLPIAFIAMILVISSATYLIRNYLQRRNYSRVPSESPMINLATYQRTTPL